MVWVEGEWGREDRRRGGGGDHVAEDVDGLLPDQESETTGDDDDEESHQSDEEHPLGEELSSHVRWSGNRRVPMQDSAESREEKGECGGGGCMVAHLMRLVRQRMHMT